MTDETETHEAAPESSHEDTTPTATPFTEATPTPAKAPAAAANPWFDLGPVDKGVHYESKTGQQFVLSKPAKRQVQFARGVDTSSITDAETAQAVITKVPGSRMTFRYQA